MGMNPVTFETKDGTDYFLIKEKRSDTIYTLYEIGNDDKVYNPYADAYISYDGSGGWIEKDEQYWKKGNPDPEGYFYLTNMKGSNAFRSKVMTITSDGLKMKGIKYL